MRIFFLHFWLWCKNQPSCFLPHNTKLWIVQAALLFRQFLQRCVTFLVCLPAEHWPWVTKSIENEKKPHQPQTIWQHFNNTQTLHSEFLQPPCIKDRPAWQEGGWVVYTARFTCRGLSAEWALDERGGGHSWLGSPAAITSWYQRSKSSLGIWGLSRSGWPFTHIGMRRKAVGWNETGKWGKEPQT